METKNVGPADQAGTERPKDQDERLREEGRRDDGTRGDLDMDKDGAAHRERREEKHDTSTEQRGTGIPGFGV